MSAIVSINRCVMITGPQHS